MSKQGQTRDRILAAALRLFAERGFSGTSIGDIESAAGLSPRSGALYKHFPSKLALLQAALDERMRAIDDFDARLEISPLGDLRAELTLVARWALAELARERDLVRLVMRDGDRVPEVAERFRDAIVRRGLTLATEVIERYAEQRDSSFEDPKAVGEALCASLVGYSLQQTLFGNDFVGVDEERFTVAWVDGALMWIENLERSTANA